MAANYEKGMYNQLMDIMKRLDTVENSLRDEKIEHKEDVDRLNKKIVNLEKENQLLVNDNERLKSILNNDSSNTSLPPSADQKTDKKDKTDKPANTFNGRENTDKKGEFSIPPEYRSDVTYGSEMKSLAVALYSEGVMSNDRIAAFLNAASNDELTVSAGTVYECCKKFSKQSETSIEHLETELLNSGMVATDATTVTVNGKQNYIRNFSIDKAVIYRAMKSKSISALKTLGFLLNYTGILIHDHETALYHFGTDHGECNVHVIRYLRKNTEDTKHTWSDKMITLLCKANDERKALKTDEINCFSESTISKYEMQYNDLIALGRTENKTTAHKYAKKNENTLLNRLEKYKHNHLLFLHNFEVLFDDNISERDLRKVRNRQKMAGDFRKDSGHEMYCKILTMVETLKRRNMGIIKNIKLIFEGTPAIF